MSKNLRNASMYAPLSCLALLQEMNKEKEVMLMYSLRCQVSFYLHVLQQIILRIYWVAKLTWYAIIKI